MKWYMVLFVLFIPALSFSQIIFSNDFEDWSGGVPSGWNGSQTNIGAGNFQQYTASAAFGTSSCQLINTTTNHKRFTTTAVSISNGQTYSISFWVRGKGDIRTGLYNGIDPNQNTYASYISVNSDTWTKYTQQIVANATSSNAEFIFSVKATDASMDHIQIDSVTIFIASTTIDTIPIYQIQYTTDPSGNSPYMDQIVVTYGTVTAVKPGNGFFIQDGTGPWSGLFIYNNTYTVQPGDSVVLRGKIVEYYGWTEMTQVSALNVVGQATIPEPTPITTAQVNTEEYESVLVKVENAQCTNANAGFGMWVVNDGSGFAKIDDFLFSYTPTLDQIYTIIGPIRYSFSEFRISPRSAFDIIQTTALTEMIQDEISISLIPNGTITISAPVPVRASLFNIAGSLIQNTNNPAEYIVISPQHISHGIYVLQIFSDNGDLMKVQKIFIH